MGIMAFFLRFVVQILSAIILGLGLTAIALSTGSGLAAKRQNGWISWEQAGHINADPYTRAFIAKTGQLPIPGQIANTYYALSDNAYRRLHTSCTYRVESPAVAARWWSIAAYNHDGLIFSNDLNRYSFNASNSLIHFDGSFRIYLSQTPSPENWIPLGNSGPFILVFRLYRAELTEDKISESSDKLTLPIIKRVSC